MISKSTFIMWGHQVVRYINKLRFADELNENMSADNLSL